MLNTVNIGSSARLDEIISMLDYLDQRIKNVEDDMPIDCYSILRDERIKLINVSIAIRDIKDGCLKKHWVDG